MGFARAFFAAMRLARKLVQGGTVAVLAVVGAQLAMAVLLGARQLYLGGLALSVGVPSFLAAVLLFPVSGAVVASRWKLAAHVIVATGVVCIVNRLLVFRVWEDQRRLASLLPDPTALDGNATLLLAAMVTAVVMAFAAQPAMARAARRV